MAQKTIVTVECDWPHDVPVEAVKTTTITVDGVTYEKDECAEHATATNERISEIIQGARAARSVSPVRRTPALRQRSRDVRAWARQHGVKVSERGRIPADVIRQYQASGGGRPPAQRHERAAAPAAVQFTPPPVPDPVAEPEPAPAKGRGGKRGAAAAKAKA